MDKNQDVFQSDFRKWLLKVHAAYMKVENVVTFPFRWVANSFDSTGPFREETQLRVVK